MFRDIEKVDEILKLADEIISDRPELLTMDVDEIFDEFDDKTSEMLSIRWGIMTRAKMSEIVSYETNDLIVFLLKVNEWDLLREYVGYVLQKEYNISLITLLIEASKRGVLKEIFPFAISSLEYEKTSSIDKIDEIVTIISLISDEWKKDQFLHKYAVLVVNNNNENVIIEKFLADTSDGLEELVSHIGKELFSKRYADAKQWLDVLLGEREYRFRLIGINYLYYSLLYNIDVFEKYFLTLEKVFCADVGLWKRLIPVYIRYLLSDIGGVYKEIVKSRLLEIRNKSVEEKRILVQGIRYDIRKSSDCKEIMEYIIELSFEKDKLILDSLDYYLSDLFEESPEETLLKLYKIYEMNEYGERDGFLDTLSQTSSLMSKKQIQILKMWWRKLLYGKKSDFYLSIEMFSEIVSLKNVDILLKEIETSKEELLSFLEGICLFTIEDKKIAELTFIVASHIKDNEFFVKYCIDNIYSNYAGVLLAFAEKYVECDDEYKSDLAKKLIAYYEENKEKINMGYRDRDFIPPTDRQEVYWKMQNEQNRRINKMAEEKSFFASLFPSRKMKFGKRFAFVQTLHGGEKNYSVSEYMQHSISTEIPKFYVNNPIEYIYMRNEYLSRRTTNEIDN